MSKKIGIKHGLKLFAERVFKPGDSRHKLKQSVQAVRDAGKADIGARAFLGDLTPDRAKAEVAALPSAWAASDGIVRSHGTLETYWPIWDRYTSWVRAETGVGKWDDFHPCGPEFAGRWLQLQKDAGVTPDTLTTYRSALRLLHFGQKGVASEVEIPLRKSVVKSRNPAKRDRGFQPKNHQAVIQFVKSTGLRLNELRNVRVCDVRLGSTGKPVGVFANANKSAKGGRDREVILGFAEHRAAVDRALKAAVQREPNNPEAKLFARIPDRLNAHALRREFARDLYQRLSGRELPPPLAAGRLKPGAIDKAAAGEVAVALGHGRHRIDTVVKNYLR